MDVGAGGYRSGRTAVAGLQWSWSGSFRPVTASCMRVTQCRDGLSNTANRETAQDEGDPGNPATQTPKDSNLSYAICNQHDLVPVAHRGRTLESRSS
jgi:hypothetical protein